MACIMHAHTRMCVCVCVCVCAQTHMQTGLLSRGGQSSDRGPERAHSTLGCHSPHRDPLPAVCTRAAPLYAVPAAKLVPGCYALKVNDEMPRRLQEALEGRGMRVHRS